MTIRCGRISRLFEQWTWHPVPSFTPAVVRGTIVAGCTFVSGCTRSPSLDILGSFFPSWLLCLILGGLVAIAVKLAIGWVGFRDDVPYPLPTYVALTLAVTCAIWLLWFGH